MKVNEDDIFFLKFGEIWYNLLAIDFLARGILSKFSGEESLFPTPPYKEYKQYKVYPSSFATFEFSTIVKDLNEKIGKKVVPDEIIRLRNGLAHGVTAKINFKKDREVIKFKKNKKNELIIDFYLELSETNLDKTCKYVISIRENLVKLFNSM